MPHVGQRCGLCRFWYNGDMDERHPDHHRGDSGSCFVPIPESAHHAVIHRTYADDGKQCRCFMPLYIGHVTFHDYTHQKSLKEIDREHWI